METLTHGKFIGSSGAALDELRVPHVHVEFGTGEEKDILEDDLQKLVSRVLHNYEDQDAWEELSKYLHNMFFNITVRRLSTHLGITDYNAALDIIQEILFAVSEALRTGRYDPDRPGAFRNYCFSIMLKKTNRYILMQRKERTRFGIDNSRNHPSMHAVDNSIRWRLKQVLEVEDVPSQEPGIEYVDKADLMDRLSPVLKRIIDGEPNPRRRIAFVMRMFQGHDFKDIGDVLGVRVPRACQIYYDALTRVQRLLREDPVIKKYYDWLLRHTRYGYDVGAKELGADQFPDWVEELLGDEALQEVAI